MVRHVRLLGVWVRAERALATLAFRMRFAGQSIT